MAEALNGIVRATPTSCGHPGRSTGYRRSHSKSPGGLRRFSDSRRATTAPAPAPQSPGVAASRQGSGVVAGQVQTAARGHCRTRRTLLRALPLNRARSAPCRARSSTQRPKTRRRSRWSFAPACVRLAVALSTGGPTIRSTLPNLSTGGRSLPSPFRRHRCPGRKVIGLAWTATPAAKVRQFRHARSCALGRGNRPPAGH
jgi:hypothetical protein